MANESHFSVSTEPLPSTHAQLLRKELMRYFGMAPNVALVACLNVGDAFSMTQWGGHPRR